MSRLVTDRHATLLAKGFVLALLAISLLSLAIELRNGGSVASLSGQLTFVYVSAVLTVGVFTDRLFAPRIQIALFVGFTAYWAYDFLVRDTALSALLVVFGFAVLLRQGWRLVR